MKQKFNKEERKAIISKLRSVAEDREKESWKQLREQYTPSERYLQLEKLLTLHSNTLNELTSKFNDVIPTYFGYRIDIKSKLDDLRDSELRPFVNRYRVNENKLDVELILSGNNAPIEEIIENLLNLCK